MSGNPFRRNAPAGAKLQAEEKRVESRTPSPFKIGKKAKRVKIQTPPQSPEEPPRRLSAGRVSPPPPERTESDDDDGSDTTATADSDIDQAARNTRRNEGSLGPPGMGMGTGTGMGQAESGREGQGTTVGGGGGPGTGAGGAPYNPFARTMATNEAAFGRQRSREGQDDSAQPRPEGGKNGMDVDMFKNILMTGSPAPTPPQQTQQSQHDSSSNTDTSSVSKHSLFDQNYNLHPESPRSSLDHGDYSDEGEADDERGGLMGGNKERLDDFAPPAPPKPGQTAAKPARGPQTVSFADFDDFSPVDERSQSPANAALARKHIPPALHRTSSDLNKPLPKTPPRSPGLPQETPLSMDTQVAQQTRQPPTPTVTSPGETSKKAPPPPPPTSRRAGQTGTTHDRARNTSDTTSHDVPHEPSSPPDTTTPKSAAPPPPPPPSRKTKPAAPTPSSAVSTPASEVPPTDVAAPTEMESKGMAPPPPPAPAPRRNPSTKNGPSSIHRSPSNASSHASSLRHEAHNSSAAPPVPPPPRRAAGSKRESLDGTWQNRRSSQSSLQSARSGSLSKPTLPSESEETGHEEQSPGQSTNDVLADMSAFQAEIDALRKQAERNP